MRKNKGILEQVGICRFCKKEKVLIMFNYCKECLDKLESGHWRN